VLDKDNTQDGRYLYPWEKAFARVLTPFEEFIQKQTTSGIMLMATAFVAIILANSPLNLYYEHLIHTPISVGVGEWILQKSLAHWVNEGLMTLFFLVVGLEIKREILIGELSDIKKAALPMIAAVGGMLVPALIYRFIAPTPEIMRGWGIPMATDIAFCVSALVILGRRVPRPLMIFLVALAIVDDLGAVLVIALFYTGQLDFTSLGWSALALLIMVSMNLGGVRRTSPYVIGGLFLWFFLLESGVHATIAGILMAFCIPARPSCRPERFSKNLKDLLWKFDNLTLPGMSTLSNSRQFSILKDIKGRVCQAEAPLRRFESVLHHPVALLVIPIFALTNAGVHLSGKLLLHATSHPVALGVFLGLVLGKFVGITVFSWASVKVGIAELPLGMHFKHVAGVGLLGGIGFTMSIFIAELSFSSSPERLLLAKTSVILASLTSGILGILWLMFCHYRENRRPMSPYTHGHGV
jgi:NhaA family Na+:H+ antiporter